jgi:hypothetical protein
MSSILRPKAVYGPGNPVPVGHSKFHDDFVLHDESNPYVPGTTIPRLRSVPLGGRAIGFFDDEIAALVEALRAWRDDPTAKRPQRAPIPNTKHHRGKRRRAAK